MELLMILGFFGVLAAIVLDRRPYPSGLARRTERRWQADRQAERGRISAAERRDLEKLANPGRRRPRVAPPATPGKPVPIWMECGWRFTSNGYVGKYKTPHGSWKGRAYYDQAKGELRYLIHNPPSEALRGNHSACFHRTEEPGMFWVHLNQPPEDLFAGIVGIQKTLLESFER